MLVTVKDDILEMNVIVRFKRGKRVYSCSIRRGGHIQSIVGTECSTSALAEVLLEELAKDLRSGRWEIGTMNGRPYAKRTDSSLRSMMAATNWGSEE